MSGSSLTRTSGVQASVSDFMALKVSKNIFTFTGDSATGAIPTLATPFRGKLVKAVFIPGSTAPSNNTTIKILDPDSGLDMLKGAAVVTAGNTAQEFYPVVASGIAIQPMLPYSGSYTLSITGNTVAGATGTVEIYTSDWH